MNCTILLGSGADTDCCAALPAGQAFANALIYDEHKEDRESILGKEAASFSLIHPNSTKVYLQTIYLNRDDKTCKEIFGEELIDRFVRYYLEDKDKPSYDEIKADCSTFYHDLTNTDLKKGMPESKKAVFFLEHAVFFDSIDEKFNALRLPKDNNPKIKRVKNTYLTIYLLLLKTLYQLPKGSLKSYRDIFECLKGDYKINKRGEDTYYDLIHKSKKAFHLITTNYTKLAEKYAGQKVTYLHGKMTWFEDLNQLTVYDCEDPEEREQAKNHVEDLIPFILIPSGVKPIICKRQIEQFSQFIDALQQSKTLCVIGYKFNTEDNHINSIIADWLSETDHKMVYFNFNGDLCFRKLAWMEKYLSGLKSVSKFDSSAMDKTKILNVEVNGNNSRTEFKKFLTWC